MNRYSTSFQKNNFSISQLKPIAILVASLLVFFSCNGKKRQSRTKKAPALSITNPGSPLTAQAITKLLLSDTFNFYAISKKYDGENDSINYTLTIFKAEPLKFKVISGDNASVSLNGVPFRMKAKVQNNLLCLTDMDGLYGNSKGQSRCYVVYQEGNDYKILDADTEVFKKRTGFFHNHGGDVGFLVTKEVIEEFPDVL